MPCIICFNFQKGRMDCGSCDWFFVCYCRDGSNNYYMCKEIKWETSKNNPKYPGWC